MSKEEVEIKENEILNNEIFEQIDGLQQAKQDPECNLLTVQKRYVECIAKHYENKGLSHDELIKAGNKGLLAAAERLIPTKRVVPIRSLRGLADPPLHSSGN